MNNTAHYARALDELVTKNPDLERKYLRNFFEVLGRKGHTKLLPRIFSEYERMQLKKRRSEAYAHITPEQEQTRVLVELYRTLLS